MNGQISIFDLMYPQFKIDKPIRLIELFSGISSQAMALRDMGVDFEHYLTCEWDVNAIASCKAIHFADDHTDYSKDYTKENLIDILFDMGISTDGKSPLNREQVSRHNEKWLRETYNNIRATKNLVNIQCLKGEDLKITNTDQYTYIVTYSFPCQDLSLAGKRKGMSKGSGTRSGLLWEVERLLGELDELPQVLLMENVPQVMAADNIDNFHDWCNFLESKGYKCYAEILNAKDYGVPQNRERAFMVSILGDYSFQFPEPIELTTCMNDFLEDEVDEKYYVNTENAQKLIDDLISSGKLNDEFFYKSARQNDTEPLGHYKTGKGGVHQSNAVHGANEVSITIDTRCSIYHFMEKKVHE